MKCFQDSHSRAATLDAAEVFTDPRLYNLYNDLRLLRNRHVLHDENDWMRAVSYAVLRKRGHAQVIGDVNCVVLEGLDTARIGQLREVVDTAAAWVQQEFDKHAEDIRQNLRQRNYDDLIALPAPTFNTPTTGSIGQRRTP